MVLKKHKGQKQWTEKEQSVCIMCTMKHNVEKVRTKLEVYWTMHLAVMPSKVICHIRTIQRDSSTVVFCPNNRVLSSLYYHKPIKQHSSKNKLYPSRCLFCFVPLSTSTTWRYLFIIMSISNENWKQECRHEIGTKLKEMPNYLWRFFSSLEEMLDIKKTRINLGRCLILQTQNVNFSRCWSTSLRFVHFNLLKQLHSKFPAQRESQTEI